MAHFALFKEDIIYPFAKLGLTNSFWGINLHTIITTWIVMIMLCLIVLATQLTLKREHLLFRYLVFSFVKGFKNLFIQNAGSFEFRDFTFIASLFIFILSCNLIALIPGLEEPTSDVMTTLALGLTAFTYNQVSAIQMHGLIHYIKGYFKPFFIMAPLHIVGHLSSIISISFRLFGNIFGGSVILGLWSSVTSLHIIFAIFGIPLSLIITSFFVLFEGFIQAFVFTMLSLTYLALEIKTDAAESDN